MEIPRFRAAVFLRALFRNLGALAFYTLVCSYCLPSSADEPHDAARYQKFFCSSGCSARSIIWITLCIQNRQMQEITHMNIQQLVQRPVVSSR